MTSHPKKHTPADETPSSRYYYYVLVPPTLPVSPRGETQESSGETRESSRRDVVFDKETLSYQDPEQPMSVELVVRAMSKGVADAVMSRHRSRLARHMSLTDETREWSGETGATQDLP
jgi:hypothetical protein